MKQSLAAVLTGLQGLGSDDSRERPVDRLAAMGVIGRQVGRAEHAMHEAELCSLGVDLIAFKFGNRAASKPASEDKLSLVLAWPSWKLKLTARQRDKVAAWAVREWAVDMCNACTGALVVPDHDHADLEGAQPMKPCTSCGGTGKRRYSDTERAEALGGDFHKALSQAHGIIGRAEDLAVQTTKTMLERWDHNP